MKSPKDLKFIIVGAGFGGLACAITLAIQGCHVEVFELSPDLTRQGDVIMIGSNATRIISSWDSNIMDEIWKAAAQPEFLKIHNKDGKCLLEQPLPKDFDGFPNIYTNRTKLQNLLYQYALTLGIKFTFGIRVSEYFENRENAGITVDGVEYTADAVLAADGVHSKGRAFVTGKQDKALKSGFAVYRSWFPLDRLKNSNLTNSIATSDKDYFAIWIAEDTHAIITSNVAAGTCVCFATHKDKSDIEESWHLKGSVTDMLAVVEGWDPVLRQTVKSIPDDAIIDHKLLWRDPNQVWTSKEGRITLVGDAAHPHLATSGTGGAQAIEDAATIGALVSTGYRDGLPALFRAYERLRYERTSLTQRMGWETRHRWHQTDWEVVAANPEFLKLPQPAWLNGHDAENYAREQYDAVMSHLREGTPFQSTNIPEGHEHQDWTIADMMMQEGQKVDNSFYQVKQ